MIPLIRFNHLFRILIIQRNYAFNHLFRRTQKANPEIFKAYQKQYAIDNSGHQKAKIKKWREDNPKRAAEYASKWARENPDLRRISAGARRARIKDQAGVVSKNIVQILMRLQCGKCAICKVNLSKAGDHLDHVMPLALGGLHDDSNLQLLCPTCNLSKNAKHPIDFMQEKGFLL